MDNFSSVCTLQFGIMYLGTIDYRVLIQRSERSERS